METYHGHALSEGIAYGRVLYTKNIQWGLQMPESVDSDQEITRFDAARCRTVEHIGDLCQKAQVELGDAAAATFRAHIMMAEDAGLMDSVHDMIRTQNVTAEYALMKTMQEYQELFSSMEDAYLNERISDIRDVCMQTKRFLEDMDTDDKSQRIKAICDRGDAIILVGEEITPSQVINIGKEHLGGCVMHTGSGNSHTAIFSRTMQIPNVTDVPVTARWDGQMMMVDGYTGAIYINPDEKTLQRIKDVQNEIDKRREFYEQYRGKESVTGSGEVFHVYANINGVEDASYAMSQDAEGIGLLRSEYLCLEQNAFPTEDEQVKIYHDIADAMNGREVTVRTFDIREDKRTGSLVVTPEILRKQMRAILRVGAMVENHFSVMYPVIRRRSEVLVMKQMMEEESMKLYENGVELVIPKQGIMIETPEAVEAASILAREVAFFSIGTNDLIHYTFNEDRLNGFGANEEAYIPIILRMIKSVVDYAHEQGVWVTICGELASNELLTEEFVHMGIDGLSVAPSMVLPMRGVIRGLR